MALKVFLVLDLKVDKAFDADKICNHLRVSPAIRSFSENTRDDRFSLVFGVRGHSAEAYMPAKDHRCIIVSGEDNAVLQLSAELQRYCDVPIHIVGHECDFDILASSVTSLADFRAKIESNWGIENLTASRQV